MPPKDPTIEEAKAHKRARFDRAAGKRSHPASSLIELADKFLIHW